MSLRGIFIALGANLPSDVGSPAETIRAALDRLGRRGVRIENCSHFYKTTAWPDPSQPPFVNAVARVATDHAPRELLQLLHETETVFGRTCSARNAPRTLDIDLIDYEGRVEQGPPTLPHPRAAARSFVLIPLADVAPNWCHPVTGLSVERLIEALPESERRLNRVS